MRKQENGRFLLKSVLTCCDSEEDEHEGAKTRGREKETGTPTSRDSTPATQTGGLRAVVGQL